MFKNLDKPTNSLESDWWIKIHTANPLCIYYFGAFESFTAAALAQHSYILDLQAEEAKILSVKIEQCQPQQLTVVLEEASRLLSKTS